MSDSPRFKILRVKHRSGSFTGCEPLTPPVSSATLSGALTSYLEASAREPNEIFGMFERDGSCYVNRGWVRNGRAV